MLDLSPAVLNEISALLVEAENSSDPQARAAAVQKLWTIYDDLERQLTDADRDTREGIKRRVESVSFRATLAILGTELEAPGEKRRPLA